MFVVFLIHEYRDAQIRGELIREILCVTVIAGIKEHLIDSS